MIDAALAVVRKDERGTRGVVFDRETVEFARLNDKVQKRRDAQRAAQVARDETRRRQRDYEWFCTMSYGHMVLRALILVFDGIWTADGILPLWLSVSVAAYCLASALIRVGVWIEKARNRK